MIIDHAVSIVTGASGGIGRAIAVALGARHGRIIVVGRRAGALDTTADAIAALGGEAVTVVGDVADPDTSRAAVDAAQNRFGRLDALVNAAGFGPPMSLVDLTEDVCDATIGSCLTGVYRMTRAALPLLLDARSAAVVNVASIAGKGAEANRTAYCAAKWGVRGFSLALRAELDGTAVRVDVLDPAGVATNWWDVTGDPQPPEVLAGMLHADDVAAPRCGCWRNPTTSGSTRVDILNVNDPWRPR